MKNLFDRINQTIENFKPAPMGFYTNSVIIHETPVLKLHASRLNNNGNPSLTVPPLAGHTSVICDYDKNQSVIETIMNNTDTTVAWIEWLSATQVTKDTSIEDLIVEIKTCAEILNNNHPEFKTHIRGLCQGGWASALTVANHNELFSKLTIMGAPILFRVESSAITKLVDSLPMWFYEKMVRDGNGLMPGKKMLEGWRNMHPYDRWINDIWTLFNSTIEGKEELNTKLVRFNSWYNNTIDLAGNWYKQAIKNLFKDDNIQKYGNFKNITIPIDIICGEKDDITLLEQSLYIKEIVSTKDEDIRVEIVEGVGHIGVFMSKVVQPIIAKLLK